MTKNKFFAFFACLMIMSFRAPDSHVPDRQIEGIDMCQMYNNTWQHDEVLTYKIYYNWNFVWLSAGEVTMRVKDEGTQYHITADGDTYNSYEWFFEVHDRYQSWVDKNTLLPNYSERSVHEGGYKIFEKVSYNQTGKHMQVWRAKKRGDPETKTEHPVNHCAHDVLSIMYALRNIDFQRQGYGAKVPFQIFMDQEEFPLYFKYNGQFNQKKIHGIGKFKVMEFEPTLISGSVFQENAKMKVWVGDDENRIPLMIESPVSVGSVKVVLKSYSGLKYPLSSKK
jgi:hypothetical protein